MTFTFLTSVFFRHDTYTYVIRVFQTRHLHNDISVFQTSTLIKPVYFTWHLHIWHQCFSDNTFTGMTSVFLTHEIHIDDYIVFKTWHLDWWHQCISHDIYMYDISVFQTSTFMTSMFQTWHLHWWHQCISHDIKWKPFHLQMSKMTNSFHNRTATQLHKNWWQCHHWSFCLCELKQEASYVILICYLPWVKVVVQNPKI
jgi:hypothetical protein